MKRRRHDEPSPAWRYRVVTKDAAEVGRRAQSGTAITRGNSGNTIVKIMRRFDRLPPAVRQALKNSAHDWAPHWAEYLLDCGYSAQDVVEQIERADREEARKRLLGLLRGEG